MHTPPRRILRTESRGRFIEEHQEAAHLIRMLRDASTLEDVAVAVATLKRELPGHFATEEGRDGLFEWLRALAPARVEDVDTLVDQHGEILAGLHQTAASLDLGIEDVLARARALADALERHEHLELSVLADALEVPEEEL